MRFHHCLLPLAAALLLATFAQAQTPASTVQSVITGQAQALAARDSVLFSATHTRQALEDQTSFFRTRRFRVGHRRTITQGFRRTNAARKVSGTGEITTPRREKLWRHVTIRRRSGVTVERFRGYYNDLPVLKELRYKGALTYVRVTEYGTAGAVKYQHSLTSAGEVQWKGGQYLVTTPVKL